MLEQKVQLDRAHHAKKAMVDVEAFLFEASNQRANVGIPSICNFSTIINQKRLPSYFPTKLV